MAFEDPRKPSAVPCIYWDGTKCIATQYFTESTITCFNESNCDGFGTCRGCSKYDQGGMKLSEKAITPEGTVIPQTPMNLKVINARARIAPCCFWDGAPDDFAKTTSFHTPVYSTVTPGIPQSPTVAATKVSKCTLTEAAPWQIAFTTDNPSAYGCNGAKAECPFYTGPKFTEVVDEKLDVGNRVTAKQILELRFYSTDWSALSDPDAEYKRLFEQGEIWAWARDTTATTVTLPGPGRLDAANRPMLQKVSIADLKAKTPVFTVDPVVTVTTGSPVIDQPPNFPTLVRELFLLPTGMKVLWPPKTTATAPFIRRSFTTAERNIFLSVLINSDRSSYAVNITKNPQGGKTDQDFIAGLLRTAPEEVVNPAVTGLPGKTFNVSLVSKGGPSTLNHIRLYLDTGATDGSFQRADVYVRHIFYHGHVAQTSFEDFYGHNMVDPWINHFTRMKIKADFLNLTSNVSVHDVLWNTITTNGQKTMYAIEEQVETSSEDPSKITWEPIDCGYVAVTFLDKVINRVYPWAAWGNDSKGQALYVKVDRSGNSDLLPGEAKEVTLTVAAASTKGTAFPANVAFFKLPTTTAVRAFDKEQDVLRVRYAYTDYKQGPIATGDESKLKFATDINKIIDRLIYDVSPAITSMEVEGTFVKVGDDKIYSCDQVIGDCYTKRAADNEKNAQRVFLAGGINEDTLLKNETMVNTCAETFNGANGSKLFQDGKSVTYAETVNRLSQKFLYEGDQRYSVVFKDETGRPIGTKTPTFLLQSALVQTRDVEIRYKWAARMQHYATRNGQQVQAAFHRPIFSSTDRLLRLIQEYDPECGDHAETTVANELFRAFDLATNKHGALWYPYKRCLTPTYHSDNSVFTNVNQYTDIVEGFGQIPNGFNSTGLRRDYWEKMRFFDKFMPAVMDFIASKGCFWSERTTTVNANKPVSFTGYTKVRSGHPFGDYASDREAVRVSRHWQKRNLTLTRETITQETNGLSLSLSPSASDAFYDAETGLLVTGSGSQTPIWVHINDSINIVLPGTEETEHPFAHLTMQSVGDYTYNEVTSSTRHKLSDVFEDRDYTSNAERSTDGSKVYLSNGTVLNVEDSAKAFVAEQKGKDTRWVYKNDNTGWAWMASPAIPDRAATRITGLFISNPARVLFKTNKEPATFTTEGSHVVSFIPHKFTASGTIDSSASLDLDGGPKLYVSQTNGSLFILSGVPSPYDPSLHEGGKYQFVLHGTGVKGTGILADARGLQRYESGGVKYATLAGVNINTSFDIDELPYSVTDISAIGRLSGAQDEQGNPQANENDKLTAISKSYTKDERAPINTAISFHGHYYVESVVFDFSLGGGFDIPVIVLTGQAKQSGVAVVSATVPTISILTPTTYQQGALIASAADKQVIFNVNRRMFNLNIALGSRLTGRQMNLKKVAIALRDPVSRQEQIFVYEPRVNISTAIVGTHKPSDIEFYFQRSFPDFATDYTSGILSIGDFFALQDVTAIPGVELKWQGRQVRDIVPTFDFTDPVSSRFPYDNIDVTKIPGYAETVSPSGKFKYINTPVATSSKGWTMVTSKHYNDPGSSLIPTDSGPDEVVNVYDGNRPVESLQEKLYSTAGALNGSKVTIYNSYWHPAEKEFFTDTGIDLDSFTWQLKLTSAIAPISRVYRHGDYGCTPGATNENLDGLLHRVDNWQARGVFHYLCQPKYSYSCLTTVMNKCNTLLFREFGTSKYLDNNVIDRFTYVFSIDPRDYQSYIAAGLINKDERGGVIGGTGDIASTAAASVPAPDTYELILEYDTNIWNVNVPTKGPGSFD